MHDSRPVGGLAAGLLVALAAGAALGGWAMQRAVTPVPAGPLAACRTRTVLGPRTYAGSPAMCIDLHRKYLATLDTTKGRIGVLLDPALAPKTVNNFIVLALHGYYTGLTFFHPRTWVIQTGDPEGDGRGGPGYNLPAEGKGGLFPTGSVGMARFPDGTISGGQVFFVRGPWPNGPGATVYNRFGSVLQGGGLLTSLGSGDRILDVSVKPT
ncbi:MAG: peptidylprolyl isomerase [Candidatus Dormibacterales bacterium]